MSLLPALVSLLLAAAPQASPAPAESAPMRSIDGLPLGALPKQDLPKQGCAAYLWTASGTRALVAMANADPARLRLSLAGTIVDLERSGQFGAGNFGLSETTTYGGGGTSAKLTLRVETRSSITGGGVVPDGILQLDRTGQDSVVIPVAGLIGCT